MKTLGDEVQVKFCISFHLNIVFHSHKACTQALVGDGGLRFEVVDGNLKSSCACLLEFATKFSSGDESRSGGTFFLSGHRIAITKVRAFVNSFLLLFSQV
jgi:hypothetical protein